MIAARHASGLAGLVVAFGAVAVGLSQLPVSGQPAPVQVTTDTPEYCLQLLDRVSQLVRATPAGPPAEVTSLAAEGQRMCDQGQTRGGILRLRHALRLLNTQTN